VAGNADDYRRYELVAIAAKGLAKVGQSGRGRVARCDLCSGNQSVLVSAVMREDSRGGEFKVERIALHRLRVSAARRSGFCPAAWLEQDLLLEISPHRQLLY
jgi:hypothetical protein